MLEAAIIDHVQTPPAYVREARRKKRGRRSSTRRDTRRINPAFYVGAIIILMDDDGQPYECEITTVTESGDVFCIPL